jgi:hypothetical protein
MLDLSGAGRHTTSSGTQCSAIDQTWSQCGANHLPPTCPSPLKRSLGELPRSLSRTYSCPGDGGAAGAPPHGVPYSEPARPSAHSMLLAAAQCSQAGAVKEGVVDCHAGLVHDHGHDWLIPRGCQSWHPWQLW